jgi:NAD+ kinase
MTRRVIIMGDLAAEAGAALEQAGWEIVSLDPDVVFCHGGDGTLLRAERIWPGVPKVPARIGLRAALCERHGLDAIVSRIASGELSVHRLPKLELRMGRYRAHAMNDIVVRNTNPTTAVRLTIELDGRTSEEISGDGLVVTTPFGSSAYYRSITGSTFEEGIGIAFNNATEPRKPIVYAGDRAMGIDILRGPAVLACDNDSRPIPLRAGHRFTVQLSSERALVHGLDSLSCQECLRQDGSRFNPH